MFSIIDGTEELGVLLRLNTILRAFWDNLKIESFDVIEII
jgi:hypothetical protein